MLIKNLELIVHPGFLLLSSLREQNLLFLKKMGEKIKKNSGEDSKIYLIELNDIGDCEIEIGFPLDKGKLIKDYKNRMDDFIKLIKTYTRNYYFGVTHSDKGLFNPKFQNYLRREGLKIDFENLSIMGNGIWLDQCVSASTEMLEANIWRYKNIIVQPKEGLGIYVSGKLRL